MDLFNDGRRHGYIKTIFGERKRFRIAFAILDRVIETFISRKNVGFSQQILIDIYAYDSMRPAGVAR